MHVTGDALRSIGEKDSRGADPYQGKTTIFHDHIFCVLDKQHLYIFEVRRILIRSRREGRVECFPQQCGTGECRTGP